MKKTLLSSALLAVLSLTLVSCNKQETIDRNARNFVSARGDYLHLRYPKNPSSIHLLFTIGPA